MLGALVPTMLGKGRKDKDPAWGACQVLNTARLEKPCAYAHNRREQGFRLSPTALPPRVIWSIKDTIKNFKRKFFVGQ
jgi:hypothetical protein